MTRACFLIFACKAMTANDIYEKAGCNAARYAVESGAYPTAQAWEVKKTRGTDLEPDRLALMLEEMLKHRDELTALIREIRKSVR